MSEPRTGPHGVIVTLPEIYAQVQKTDRKVDELTSAISELVAVNRRLDSHHEKLALHDGRIDVLEQHKAVLDSRPRAPWWAVIGAVAAIVTAAVAGISLLSLASQIGQALTR